ncbi:hypothetical protein [Pseudomonas delhiensis]|uniref:hypothetical protein n=1 Tax=Pseudomonas delhiensis TaxID=366289 RepID=UPI00315A8845
MQVGSRYTRDQAAARIYFPNPKAQLPVMIEGMLEWLPWGRRREQAGHGPAGGWARAESITEGRWAKYHPIEALIPAERFMEKDEDNSSHWFERDGGGELLISALVIGDVDDRRVYIVTGTPPDEYAWVHDRWPMLAPGIQAREVQNG